MILALLACRPDPGEPNYPDPGELTIDTNDEDFLRGDDPYEEGEDRLSIGIFYEGPVSEWVDVDNVENFFYIYEDSFSVTSSDDRVEGYTSDVLEVSKDTWWGGGIHWEGSPRDLSAYNTLNVSLKSDALEGLELGMKGGDEAKVPVSDYGYVADGEWHHLDIPLADFSGVVLAGVEIPLIIVAEGTPSGTTVLFDNLYLDVQ